MQWLMLQQDVPDDFVIATGKQYSVREFIKWTAAEIGITLRFQGEGIDEIAIVETVSGDLSVSAGDVVLRIDPRYFRPAEVQTLLGDPTKAKEHLGWVPKITAQEMCAEMVQHDLKEAKRKAVLDAHQLGVPVARGD